MAQIVLITNRAVSQEVYASGNELTYVSLDDRAPGVHRMKHVAFRLGVESKIIDHFSSLTREQLIEVIHRHVNKETKIIGFSSTFSGKNFLAVLTPAFFELVRGLAHPDLKIVFGGNHPKWEFVPNETLLDNVDYFFKGFAERAFGILVERQFHGSTKTLFPSSTMRKAKIIECDKDYRFEEDPANLDYRLAYDDSDFIEPDEMLTLEISRGCVLNCKYCKDADYNRKRSSDYVDVEENLRNTLMLNFEKFGVTKYSICDSMVNDNVGKLEMMARVVESLPFKPEFFVYVRPDMSITKPESLDLFSAASFTSLALSFGSFIPENRRLAARSNHTDKAIDVIVGINRRAKGEISMSTGLVAGLPFDTKETLQENQKQLVELVRDNPNLTVIWSPHVLTPFGSFDYQVNAEMYGYVKSPQGWVNGTTGLTESYVRGLIKEFNIELLSIRQEMLTNVNYLKFKGPCDLNKFKEIASNEAARKERYIAKLLTR